MSTVASREAVARQILQIIRRGRPTLAEPVRGVKAEDAKELRRLREENGRLKRMVADRELQIEILQETSRGNF